MAPESNSTPRRSRVFGALFVCAVLTWLTLAAFFVIGIGDGSITSFNLALWLALLSAGGLSVWAGHALQGRGRTTLALAALSVTAVPGLLAALFLLVVLVTQPRWN